MKTKAGRCIFAATIAVAWAGVNFLAYGAEPYINGSISFTGNAGMNASISAATTFTNFWNVSGVAATNGSYAPLGHAASANWTSFTFNPPTMPVMPLWTCSTNGVAYSFDATSMSVVFSSSNFLDIQGSGIAHITGYADTPGLWTIGVQQIGASVSFSASTIVSETNVPVIHCDVGGNKIMMSWNALPGLPYQLQTSTNFFDPSAWGNTGYVITTNGTTAMVSYTNGMEPGRFFRVAAGP
jgi:hypothetical protein